MTINDLVPGTRAKIIGYLSGSATYRTKLLALGLTRGSEIKITGVAPLGDPVSLEVRGFKLSLRKAEAAVVEVEIV
ncbi:MAG: ferrous iron transport protein A [Opitutae bacterium]|nr:ferrous iron transport protein A [Opitutae bacterium]MCD8298776.1 ferrous iron transport protein A [Opitutae bacterium]